MPSLVTAALVVTASSFIWTTPINLKKFRLNLKRPIEISLLKTFRPPASASTIVIKRIPFPGMKAICEWYHSRYVCMFSMNRSATCTYKPILF
ncbi:uncharacterized protein EDB91DRAFT_1188945 [Suillus paluster]|uniref:uncharacterized protein n=1 Tax=Suillus paluster TaxID=48578 RepID=UPI001B887355|nr:uncharacterized protein EDB91DRAFT_1188945 [Suillus paluster]KAG1717772.1 hypothetical protein EDB91DRAFT_1188945 [Suillus paluster]